MASTHNIGNPGNKQFHRHQHVKKKLMYEGRCCAKQKQPNQIDTGLKYITLKQSLAKAVDANMCHAHLLQVTPMVAELGVEIMAALSGTQQVGH